MAKRARRGSTRTIKDRARSARMKRFWAGLTARQRKERMRGLTGLTKKKRKGAARKFWAGLTVNRMHLWGITRWWCLNCFWAGLTPIERVMAMRGLTGLTKTQRSERKGKQLRTLGNEGESARARKGWTGLTARERRRRTRGLREAVFTTEQRSAAAKKG